MRKSFTSFLTFLLITSCLDRINIPIASEDSENLNLVVDGLISDEPGPYTVKLSTVIKIGETLPRGRPVVAKSVTIFDNAGNSELLHEVEVGTYQTDPDGIRGVIGREYHIRIVSQNDNVFESQPDLMSPVGNVDSVYYEFETYLSNAGSIEYRYRIFVDAHNIPNGDAYLRWKFVGTYVVETLPQFKICENACAYCPLPCSAYSFIDGKLRKGYAFNPITKAYEFVIGLDCTCCRCWVTQSEDKPRVSDSQTSSNGKFRKVDVGFVPVNFYTFFEKYRVQIVQMSLSRAALDYWKAIQNQKDGTGTLFQPVTGKIPTNLFEVNNSAGVRGIFYATAVTKKQIYIDKNTNRVYVKVPMDCAGREGAVGESCLLAFPGSATTTQQPADWN